MFPNFCGNGKRFRKDKTIMKKENKSEGLALPNFKTHYRA
jgi:hypothetical protein